MYIYIYVYYMCVRIIYIIYIRYTLWFVRLVETVYGYHNKKYYTNENGYKGKRREKMANLH